MINNTKYLKLITAFGFITLCTLVPSLVHAQPTDPFPGGGDPDVYVPLDGGLSIVVAACVGYGIKARKKKMEKQTEIF